MAGWQAAVMAAYGGQGLVSSTIEHRNSTFTIRENHLKLLRASVVAWSSQWNGELFGAACVDPRRPYGHQDVYRSMFRILEWTVPWKNGTKKFDIETDEIPDDQINLLEALHQETEIALRICLSLGTFETGIYNWPEPGEQWTKVTPPNTTSPSP
jgi:hypothetical protein